MPVFLLVFFLLMVVYACLIDYYHRAWNRQPVFTVPDPMPAVSISIIVPVRNEEENIEALLQSFYNQVYPKNLYQVIIVDDHSTDSSWSLLQKSVYNDPELIILRMDEQPAAGNGFTSHKKRAIDTGIRVARGTLIVTTDADCRFKPGWLKSIAAYYESTGAKFIAAPVTIGSNKSLLSVFQTLDFLTLQGITGAAVYKRIHSMCNGANLAFEKDAFMAVNGYEGIGDIASGDDMLLMHKIYKQYPQQVFYLKIKDSIVVTKPALTWSTFFHQRIRWASKADSYDDKRIFWVLLLVYLVNLCFLVVAVASFWKNIWLFFFCVLLLAKILIEFPFVYAVAAFFDQRRLMYYFPFLQPLHIVYTIIAGWMGKFGSYTWKGRKIKK
jgi:glycosyltransferase involved in cell wall biosynthesis